MGLPRRCTTRTGLNGRHLWTAMHEQVSSVAIVTNWDASLTDRPDVRRSRAFNRSATDSRQQAAPTDEPDDADGVPEHFMDIDNIQREHRIPLLLSLPN